MFKIRNKKAFFSFVAFGLTACVPPWFINFREIHDKWTLLWLAVMAFSGMVLLLFPTLEARKREDDTQGGTDG